MNITLSLLTAFIGVLGVLVGSLVSWGVQARLLDSRITADGRLAERKFQFDKDLAERKFEQEKLQFIFKRRFELAESLLSHAYRFREMMEFVRNGAAFEAEGESRPNRDVDEDHIKHSKDVYYVPIERLQKNNEFISGFIAKRYSELAQFGSEIDPGFLSFHKSVVRVRAAASRLINTLGRPNFDIQLHEKLCSDIWAGTGQKTL